jgi:hypothetical protein
MSALLALSPPQPPGAPHPRFPVESRGFPELPAPFLNERRTRGPFQSCVQEIRGISLVFREMWDTANLPSSLPRSPLLLRVAPCSRQRTWAENDRANARSKLCLFLLLRMEFFSQETARYQSSVGTLKFNSAYMYNSAVIRPISKAEYKTFTT